MQISRTGHRYRDAKSGKVIDIWFPEKAEWANRRCLAEEEGLICGDVVTVDISGLDTPPVSTEDAYLRLHLLSETKVRPNAVNLDGLFDLLNNVAWTSAGGVLPEQVPELRARVAARGHWLRIDSVDKFPRMVDYVVPPQVRIADASRVRLGAHLMPGSTVMHEGFVNFNAGSLDAAMIEGRVTPGVTVGGKSDIGAGSSIMGTLSGGGKQVNSVGERSLLGANAGIGISLGDDCVVEAGLYLTAGTKVTLPDGEVRHARELSGRSGLLFRRNSQTGVVEVLPSAGTSWGGLNQILHSND